MQPQLGPRFVFDLGENRLPIMSGRHVEAQRAHAALVGYVHDKKTVGNWPVYPGGTAEVEYGEGGPRAEVMFYAVRRMHCLFRPLSLEGWGEHISSLLEWCGVHINRVKKCFEGPLILWAPGALVPKNQQVLRIVRMTSDYVVAGWEVAALLNRQGGLLHPETGVKTHSFDIAQNNFASIDPNGFLILELNLISKSSSNNALPSYHDANCDGDSMCCTESREGRGCRGPRRRRCLFGCVGKD